MICEDCGSFFDSLETSTCPNCGWDMYDDGTDDIYYDEEDADFWDEEGELV